MLLLLSDDITYCACWSSKSNKYLGERVEYWVFAWRDFAACEPVLSSRKMAPVSSPVKQRYAERADSPESFPAEGKASVWHREYTLIPICMVHWWEIIKKARADSVCVCVFALPSLILLNFFDIFVLLSCTLYIALKDSEAASCAWIQSEWMCPVLETDAI